MKLVHIFGPEDGPQAGEGLWAVEYEPGMGNAYDNLCDLWENVESMRDFCKKNHFDLQGKFGRPISINAAVNELMDEAELLMEELLDLAEGTEQGKSLQEMFRPLSNSQSDLRELQLSKGRARRPPGKQKLRIYAVRISPTTYVVTGGAIKLTDTMNERPHTAEEKDKLERVCSWLKAEGVLFPNDLNDLP